MGFASCDYLKIEPVGKVIPHKTSEFRALLTEGYQSFPFYNSKTFTGLLSDEIGVFVEGKFYTASDAIALSYNYTWQYGSQMREYPYQEYYRTIFYANAVIDGVMGTTTHFVLRKYKDEGVFYKFEEKDERGNTL
mgnify:CR=1 FL=1